MLKQKKKKKRGNKQKKKREKKKKKSTMMMMMMMMMMLRLKTMKTMKMNRKMNMRKKTRTKMKRKVIMSAVSEAGIGGREYCAAQTVCLLFPKPGMADFFGIFALFLSTISMLQVHNWVFLSSTP
jgi:hypothetical protein